MKQTRKKYGAKLRKFLLQSRSKILGNVEIRTIFAISVQWPPVRRGAQGQLHLPKVFDENYTVESITEKKTINFCQ